VTSNSVSASWIVPAPAIPAAGVTLIAPPALGAIGLVGAFTDNSGAVIEPIAIGASSREYVVPVGATQLQLGVDSAYFVTNGGPGFAVAVNGVSVTIPSTAMPWTWAIGGLNNNYQYGIYNPSIQNAILDGTNPVVAATGLTGGQTVTIAYQSGTASANYPLRPLVNADGDQSAITGVQVWRILPNAVHDHLFLPGGPAYYLQCPSGRCHWSALTKCSRDTECDGGKSPTVAGHD
jgi:hypothetical protein